MIFFRQSTIECLTAARPAISFSDMKTTRTTSHGYTVHAIHPMAASGSRYRFTAISGTTHVDEYVGSCGAWVYLGTV